MAPTPSFSVFNWTCYLCISPKLSSLPSDLPFEFKMFEKVLAERKGMGTILEHNKLLFLEKAINNTLQ